MNKALGWLTIILVAVAVACIVGLLASNLNVHISLGVAASVASAASLLLVGVSFSIVQTILRPRWTESLKNILLAAAFMLWGIVQLMEQNALSRKLGNVVVALFVMDLAWVILAGVAPVVALRSGSLKLDSSRGKV
jgi:hypothetical protein